MNGKLFVIEGLDGSGKQTQSNLLYAKLKNEGRNILKVEYPNYKSESSALVKMYLRGDFGDKPEDVSPYISSTFFAADRYASYKLEYENFYQKGGIIIADRYTTSNMVHQASKIHNEIERNKFLDWLWELEFQIYRIPIPTQVFFLDIKPSVAVELMNGRENKITHKKEKDIHEKNISHLIDSYNTAVNLVKKYNWETICCCDEKGIKPIDDIHGLIYDRLIQYI